MGAPQGAKVSRMVRTVLFLAGPAAMNLVALMFGVHIGIAVGAKGVVLTPEYFAWATWIGMTALGAYGQTVWIAWRASQRQWDE